MPSTTDTRQIHFSQPLTSARLTIRLDTQHKDFHIMQVFEQSETRSCRDVGIQHHTSQAKERAKAQCAMR